MNAKLEAALNQLEMTYSEIIEVANGYTKPFFDPINQLVTMISEKINCLSTDQVRDYILQLQLKAFEISEIKEKAALKAELAETLQKEAFAKSFNSLEGSAATKEKLATVEIAGETLDENLFSLVSNLFKTKIDQLHRLVDALKSILMSRMQENKFMQNISVGAPGEKTYLTE